MKSKKLKTILVLVTLILLITSCRQNYDPIIEYIEYEYDPVEEASAEDLEVYNYFQELAFPDYEGTVELSYDELTYIMYFAEKLNILSDGEIFDANTKEKFIRALNSFRDSSLKGLTTPEGTRQAVMTKVDGKRIGYLEENKPYPVHDIAIGKGEVLWVGIDGQGNYYIPLGNFKDREEYVQNIYNDLSGITEENYQIAEEENPDEETSKTENTALVVEPKINEVKDPEDKSLVGTMRYVTSDPANVRSGPGFDYNVVDKLPYGTQVYILDTHYANDRTWCKITEWGHWVSINNINGKYEHEVNEVKKKVHDYSYLIGSYQYVEEKTANVRTGPGFDYSIYTTLAYGDEVYISDIYHADDRIWCQIGNGLWISIRNISH